MKWFNKKYIFIVLLFFVILWIYFYYFWKKFINIKHEVDDKYLTNEREERIPFSNFKWNFLLKKEWIFLDYPKIVVLSDMEWIISKINVNIWDDVKKWKILVQIDSNTKEYENNIKDAEIDIENLQIQYQLIQKLYEQSNIENQESMKNLDEIISEKETEIIKYMNIWDESAQKIVEKEIEWYEKEISYLQINQKNKEQEFKSEMMKINSEIQSLRNIYDDNYSKLNKLNARATIDWKIWEIFVKKWDKIEKWTELLNIKNIEEMPEISFNLSFDEYLLIKNISDVDVLVEKNNWVIEQYVFSGIINSINSELDENWNVNITVKINENVKYDFFENISKILVEFNINFDWINIPENCIRDIKNNVWIISLRIWEKIYNQNVKIKYKIQNWLLIDNFMIDSLENEWKINELNKYYDFEILCNEL